MQKLDEILAELERERRKLNGMPLNTPETLKQSEVVDKLINQYYRELARESGGAG